MIDTITGDFTLNIENDKKNSNKTREKRNLGVDVTEKVHVCMYHGIVPLFKICDLVVFKTTICYRLFLKLPPVRGGGKFFNNR